MDPNQLHPDTLKTGAQPEMPYPIQGPEYDVNSHNEIEETKKVSRKFIILLGILLILIPVGIFAYSKVSTKPTVVEKVANIPTPTPAPDPTAGWQTYTNTGFGYSLKMPSDWNITVVTGADPNTFIAPVFGAPCNYEAGDLCSQISIGINGSDGNLQPDFGIGGTEVVLSSSAAELDSEDAAALIYSHKNDGTTLKLIYTLTANHKDNKFTISYEETQKGVVLENPSQWKNKKIFDQIISTFKFTAPITSPSPTPISSGDQVFCTQEAKLCPDGSYVGRQEPNCEFQACP